MPLPESHAAYEEEDTCHMSYEEEDTCHCQRAMLHRRRRIHVMSYEEEDTCHCQRAMLHPQTCTDSQKSACSDFFE